MTHIYRTTSSDVIARLPELKIYSDACTEPVDVDVLVCAAGFEDRATAVTTLDPPLLPKHVVVIKYATNEAENLPALNNLQEFVPKQRCTVVLYDRWDFRRRLRAALARATEARDATIALDISVMSSFILYRLLDTIREYFHRASLRILFAEARDYYPSEREWRAFRAEVGDAADLLIMAERFARVNFQSRGVESTYESETFPGKNVAGLPTHIIAVPNFSLERMKTMLARAEGLYNANRDDTTWLLGDPPEKPKNGWRLDALGELYQVRSKGIPVSTLDYKHMIRVLEDMWEQTCTERHLVIATLGSKMQHLATFLFLLMHREVGLVLSEPTHFVADRFSEGVGAVWWLDMGRVADLLDLLRARGTLVFQW